MSMVFSYDGLELQILSVQNYHRESIYDGPDYLYTRHLIHIRGVYNPSATSYRLPGNFQRPVPINNDKNNTATLTDHAIRHRLLQPRRQLYFSIQQGDINYVLVSPQPIDSTIINRGVFLDRVDVTKYPTDANNGPIPISCDVVKITGTKTFLVDFTIRTDVNECDLTTSDGGRALSHRWAMMDEIDDRFFTTRRIEGQVIFSTAKLLQPVIDLRPDDFRRMMVHPVGRNMKREKVNVEVHPDGHSFKYVIIDRELPFNIDPRAGALGVVKIEAGHYAELSKPKSLWEDVTITAEAAAMRVAAIIDSSDPTNWGGMRVQNIMGTFSTLVGLGTSLAPRHTHKVYAKVWGDRDSERRQLERVGYTVLLNRLALVDVFASAFTFSSFHSLTDKYVETSITYTTGPLPGSVLRENNPTIVPLVNPTEPIAGVLTQGPVANPNLQNDAASRGTFVQKLITAALSEPCEVIDNVTPPVPPAA